eukprot:1137875-Pelagomonas_calceolata.AAC.1
MDTKNKPNPDLGRMHPGKRQRAPQRFLIMTRMTDEPIHPLKKMYDDWKQDESCRMVKRYRGSTCNPEGTNHQAGVSEF